LFDSIANAINLCRFNIGEQSGVIAVGIVSISISNRSIAARHLVASGMAIWYAWHISMAAAAAYVCILLTANDGCM